MRRVYFLVILFLILAIFLSGCGVVPPLNQSPNASFTAIPTSGEIPLEVYFNASGSYDPDGNIVNYEWNFEDGNTGNGKIVNHTFSSTGNYNVRLTVTDDKGATDSTTKLITVTEIPNQSPILSLSYAEWYTTTEEIGELTFGYVHLNLSGYTTGDKVTIITYGTGVIDELELELDQDKRFAQDVIIRFTHDADDIPREYSTILTAYKGNLTTSISLESEELTYL